MTTEHKKPNEYGDWWTCPTESETGDLIMVTGRRDIEKFRKNAKFTIRIEITWKYGENGMPDSHTSEQMEEVTDRLNSAFLKDPVAVMTGIYTGAGERNWVFYSLSTHIFGRKLNESLSDLPILPLEISAENDPKWDEYAEMKSISEIKGD